MNVEMDEWKNVCTHVCTYVFMHACVYICMCVYLHMYVSICGLVSLVGKKFLTRTK